jgi:hypothetical protein
MPRCTTTRDTGRAAARAATMLATLAGIAWFALGTGASLAQAPGHDGAEVVLVAAWHSSSHRAVQTQAADGLHAVRIYTQPPATPSSNPAAASASPTLTGSPLAGNVTYYTVRDSFGGQPEFLYEIAERFLGDGNRFQEIFELNRGRLQPDGGRLTDPTVINPGWLLVLPNSAHGAGLITGKLPCCTEGSSAPSLTSAEPTGQTTRQPTLAGPTHTSTAASEGPIGVSTLIAIVLALVVAAGLGLVLFGRRPRRGTTADGRADNDASDHVDSVVDPPVAAAPLAHLGVPVWAEVTGPATVSPGGGKLPHLNPPSGGDKLVDDAAPQMNSENRPRLPVTLDDEVRPPAVD